MAKASDILGMNARERLFTPLNSKKSRVFTKSKLEAKNLLESNGIPVPKLYATFSNPNELEEFNFSSIESSFVIKPTGGNAGKGILIIKKRVKNRDDKWVGASGKHLDVKDLQLHVGDILEGIYSTYGTSHQAFVEERILIHPKFKRLAYKGTPDIRVIVYNKVPVMAMLRLPTEESEGKANLHQGAIGVGVDIATGITISAIHKGKPIFRLPNKKRKLNGIKIPKWTRLLKTAVLAAEASGLGYCGVDLLIDPEIGPVVVELNSNPGLAIQVANRDGIRRRLERVGGLKIRDETHGVRVGKSLFAEWFSDTLIAEDGVLVVDNFETIKIRNPQTRKWEEQKAKIDTGAFRTSIDRGIATDMNLLSPDAILWYGEFRNSNGVQKRPVVEVMLNIKGRKVKTTASVADRSRSASKILVGRQDLSGFLVKPMPVQDRGGK